MKKLLIAISLLTFLTLAVFSQDLPTTLEISSSPSGAQIYIDGILSGITPYVVNKISAGEHILKLSKDLYEDWNENIQVESDRSNKIHVILIPTGNRKGRIQVDCDVPQALIYLDSRFIGRTPKLVTDIEFGTHFLEVRKSLTNRLGEERSVFKDTLQITNADVILVNVIFEHCWLTIDSNPSGAELAINGNPAGTMPLNNKELKVGSFYVNVIKKGFEPTGLNLTIKPGEHKHVTVDMTPWTFNRIFYRSLIFPGVGQIYAEEDLRGYLFFISEIASIGGAIYFNSQLSDESKVYTEKYNLYKEASSEEEAQLLHKEVQESYDKMQNFETFRNILIGSAVAVWLYNLYDAYHLGKKIEENNSIISSVLNKSNLSVYTDGSEYYLSIGLSF